MYIIRNLSSSNGAVSQSIGLIIKGSWVRGSGDAAVMWRLLHSARSENLTGLDGYVSE